MVKLKEFELQHQELIMQHTESLEQLNIEYAKAHLADTANARHMQETAIESQDPVVRRFIYFYATLLTLLSFGFLYLVLFNPGGIIGDNTNKDLVNTITGFLLGTTMSAVIGFFFGSSSGSADKGKQIEKMQNKLLEKDR